MNGYKFSHFGTTHTKHEKLKFLESYLGSARILMMDPERWSLDPLLLDEMAKWLGFIDCKYPKVTPNIKDIMYYSDIDHSVRGKKCRYNSNG